MDKYELKQLSNEVTANNKKKTRRKRSLKLNHLLDFVNDIERIIRQWID